MEKRKLGLSVSFLKYYVLIAMTIDHVAWAFVPTDSALGIIMHIIGRTVILMTSFLIAEGFYYTRNIKKYISRMVIFTLISWVPYYMNHRHRLPFGAIDDKVYIFKDFFTIHSIIFTLTISLVILVVLHSDIKKWIKIIVIPLLILLTYFGDWAIIAPLYVLAFDTFRGNFKKQAIAVCAIGFVVAPICLFIVYKVKITDMLFQLATPLGLILIYLYNGKIGKYNNKWLFYWYYPAHLLIIFLLKDVLRVF